MVQRGRGFGFLDEARAAVGVGAARLGDELDEMCIRDSTEELPGSCRENTKPGPRTVQGSPGATFIDDPGRNFTSRCSPKLLLWGSKRLDINFDPSKK